MTDDAVVGRPNDRVSPPPPAPIFELTITQVTSYLIFTSRKTLTTVGSLEELGPFYRKVLTHNLLAGWWGFPFGIVWTIMNLASNRKAMAHLRELAADGRAEAGWWPDPTGRGAQRYWDGQAWTDKVADVGVDPIGPP